MYTRPLQKAFILVFSTLTIVVWLCGPGTKGVKKAAQNMKSGFYYINITFHNFLYI